MLTSRREANLVVLEEKHKTTATRAKNRLEALLNGLDNEVLSIFTGLSRGKDSKKDLSESKKKLFDMAEAVRSKARRLEIAGGLEIGAQILARFRWKTIIPYFHRDEHLERLWDFGENYKILASKLDAVSDENALADLENDVHSFLDGIGNLTRKISLESRRRIAKSVFWPVLAILSFVIMISQIALGSLNLAVVGSVIFLTSLVILLSLAVIGSIIAFIKTLTRRGKAVYFLVPCAVLLLAAMASVVWDWSQGLGWSLDGILRGLFFGILLAGLVLTMPIEVAETRYLKSQMKSLLSQLGDLE